MAQIANPTPPLAELFRRLEVLERRQLLVSDLPLAGIRKYLEQNWEPAGSDLLLPKSAGNAVLGTNAVDGRVLADGVVTDLKLASPNNGVWRTIGEHASGTSPTDVAGTYYVTRTSNPPLVSGTNAIGGVEGLIPIQAASYAVAGKTTQLRIVGVTLINGTAPANTHTHGLHPITSSGGAGLGVVTLGAAVAGSGIAVVNPAINTALPFFGPAFTLPADGSYILGFVISAAAAANSVRRFAAQVQMRHI